MALIKTVIAFTYTLFIMFFFFPFGLLAFFLSFLGLKKTMSWFIYKIAQYWAKAVIFITGCTMDVIGREHIPPVGSVCFVCNHVGIFDIIIVLAYIGRPFGFIAKKELSYIPFFNIWIYILGGIFIDRKHMRKSLKAIKLGIEKLKKGNSMVVFPEGTRSKGRGLLPFKSGSIKLATNSLVPIIPVAIAGSYEVFEKDYRVHAAPVKLVFCPVVFTAKMIPDDRRHQLAPQVRSVIESALSG
jgi:1-acyl-sn-glycerol-3-phosphate acyltransferase